MPDGFSPAQVEAIAALANLELDAEELALFARQLGEFLAYADALLQIDTTGVPPTTHVATAHVAEREDQAQPCLSQADALANAPDASSAAGLFRVPRVIG
jgi:aspartyl-tRNA(Asn)/glutamyl-tRNA(Gln) amidotransferase subunit C